MTTDQVIDLLVKRVRWEREEGLRLRNLGNGFDIDAGRHTYAADALAKVIGQLEKAATSEPTCRCPGCQVTDCADNTLCMPDPPGLLAAAGGGR